jgi:hypothetical protein
MKALSRAFVQVNILLERRLTVWDIDSNLK